MTNKPKYHNKKIVHEGLIFDSKLECERYKFLKLLEKADKIQDLQTQVAFEIIPSQKIGKKVAERPVKYIADFCYYKSDGERVVEDTKGFKTPDYIIKRKLMLYVYNIQIKEIKKDNEAV